MAGPAAQQVEEPVQVSVSDRMYLPSRHRSAKPTLPLIIDELFMQRHLPDLGQEVEDTQVFTWNLSNWRKLERKITSPDFPCGGHKWHVILGCESGPPIDLHAAQESSLISARKLERTPKRFGINLPRLRRSQDLGQLARLRSIRTRPL